MCVGIVGNRTLPPVPLPFQGRGNKAREGNNKNKSGTAPAFTTYLSKITRTFERTPSPERGGGQGVGLLANDTLKFAPCQRFPFYAEFYEIGVAFRREIV